jgi:thiaminase
MENKIDMDMTPVMEVANVFPWQEKEPYANFLAQTFYYVRHSTRLLALAAGRIAPGDRKSFDRFIKHIGEERNHEELARRDIGNLGYDLDAIPEMPCTRMLWEPQYYKVEHESPMALLGYILMLEMLAANEGGEVVKVISEAHGADCLSFLQLHGQEDVKHVQEAIKLAESLGDRDRQLIRANIGQTVYAYSTWLREIAKA